MLVSDVGAGDITSLPVDTLRGAETLSSSNPRDCTEAEAWSIWWPRGGAALHPSSGSSNAESRETQTQSVHVSVGEVEKGERYNKSSDLNDAFLCKL